MSMTMMVAAMKRDVGSPVRKLVLIKLADNANDDGECWPSYRHIAAHCSITRRSAMKQIAALEKDGYLTRQTRVTNDGNTSNVYRLNLAPLVNDIHQGANEIHPPGEIDSPPLVNEVHPEPVTTNQSVNRETTRARETTQQRTDRIADDMPLPDEVDREPWAEYVRHRQDTGKAMTDRAARLAIKKLLDMANKGHNAREVLEQSVMNGWQGLFWPKGGNGNGTHTQAGKGAAEQGLQRARDVWRQRGEDPPF